MCKYRSEHFVLACFLRVVWGICTDSVDDTYERDARIPAAASQTSLTILLLVMICDDFENDALDFLAYRFLSRHASDRLGVCLYGSGICVF